MNTGESRTVRPRAFRDRLGKILPPVKNKYFCGNLQIITCFCETSNLPRRSPPRRKQDEGRSDRVPCETCSLLPLEQVDRFREVGGANVFGQRRVLAL